MFNIRSVDLNLLPVFEAVYEEKSLSRAAVRLAMTQSAISHALSRLRFVFRDELFVRQSRGVIPTPAADRVYPKVRDALASVRESVTDTRTFEPQTSERRFAVSIPHPLGPLIELRLQERLARIAPKVVVSASTRSRPIDLDGALREGRLDVAIDWLAPVGSHFNSKLLFEDAVIAVARKGHPAFRTPVSLKTLQEGRFVGLRPRTDERGGPAHIEAVAKLGTRNFIPSPLDNQHSCSRLVRRLPASRRHVRARLCLRAGITQPLTNPALQAGTTATPR